jgi:diguanylate cyclase (GGDEF)-like protein
VVGGKPTGFLFFSSLRAGAYAGSHVAIYREIAAQVSVIVEKARMHEELLQTQRRLLEASRKLERAANTDALTGVANRRCFDLVLEREWQRARRAAEPLSLVLVDVDHFKRYNDRYGHPAGDACLARIARTLAGSVRRRTDLLARVGGEEFAVVLPRTEPEVAAELAERMRRSLMRLRIPHADSPVAPQVTVSLGVAGGVPDRVAPATRLLELGDGALYRAKQSGRNRVFPRNLRRR